MMKHRQSLAYHHEPNPLVYICQMQQQQWAEGPGLKEVKINLFCISKVFLEQTVIQVNNATVRFNMASEKIDNIKEYFVKFAKGQLHFKEFFALKDITFDVKQGESWGIVGSNGAGKSTLLRLVCGVIAPHTGSVTVSGSISPMLELGAGFDPELTAGENIYLEGALLGHSRAFMRERYN